MIFSLPTSNFNFTLYRLQKAKNLENVKNQVQIRDFQVPDIGNDFTSKILSSGGGGGLLFLQDVVPLP